ncbi:hypothetical protein QYF36_016506 [Acer negundo]|nr:hypothetical protein QYF36_016506 [Acer negundo]
MEVKREARDGWRSVKREARDGSRGRSREKRYVRFDGVSVVFRGRGANALADSLAKLGSSRAGDRLEWGVV